MWIKLTVTTIKIIRVLEAKSSRNFKLKKISVDYNY